MSSEPPSPIVPKQFICKRFCHSNRVSQEVMGGKRVERVAGVEPASLAWEARVIPIYDTRAGGYKSPAILAN